MTLWSMGRTLKTPGGRPASCATSASFRRVSGVLDVGLAMTVLPAAMAGAILCDGRLRGKLKGLIARIGPMGKRRTMPVRPDRRPPRREG